MNINHTYFVPGSLDQLDKYIGERPDNVTYVAGATDLMVREEGLSNADNLVSLTNITDFTDTISLLDSGVLIGACVPLSQIIRNKTMQNFFPLLVTAWTQIGSIQIQNRATLGGNIANASPAGDSLPVLSVYDAELWIGPQINGQFEKISIDKIMTGPGTTGLKNNQYIAYIYLPYVYPADSVGYFRKVGPRYAMAISKVSLAMICSLSGKKIVKIKIAAGSVTPEIQRSKNTEDLLLGNELTNELIFKAKQKIMRLHLTYLRYPVHEFISPQHLW